MPAYPYRRDRSHRRSWAHSHLEQWRPPAAWRTAARGALIGLAGAVIGLVLVQAAVAVSTTVYGWLS